MHYLVTGVAGFIGHRTALALLAAGHQVVGVDNLNDYYEPRLKQARLKRLEGTPGFRFQELDLADHAALMALAERDEIDRVIHLAAQAGVRYSIENPFAYAQSNLTGHLSVLEFCRHAKQQPMLIYASSSSVYGMNAMAPFREDADVGHPVSLYAATKRSDELMSRTYAHLYELKQIGLRFFTVYGPWGRPDMAYWSFTDRILKGEPIHVFNGGEMQRDFTYIDDIIDGVMRIATGAFIPGQEVRPHRLYNIGNNKPVSLMEFIGAIEQAVGRKAEMIMEPMQPGDVKATCADISAIKKDYGYAPATGLAEGIAAFVDWFCGVYQTEIADEKF